MLYLKEVSCTDGREIYDLLQTIDANENGFSNGVRDLPYEQFPTWLKKHVDMGLGLGLEDWMVPARTYWLYDGDTPVGQANIRVRLTDALREGGGTIGYAIGRPYRGRGYGKTILRLALEKCRELGVEEILVTVHPDNLPSRRVAESNGGVLKRESGEHVYYWF